MKTNAHAKFWIRRALEDLETASCRLSDSEEYLEDEKSKADMKSLINRCETLRFDIIKRFKP